ncbi:hypothetical protein, partial [Mycoplasmopsis bovis]|uniref:hypothetical protein n=1 Tax=Mycoplasmopsis bovis TaxID=28903 RepID=UPI003D2E94BD
IFYKTITIRIFFVIWYQILSAILLGFFIYFFTFNCFVKNLFNGKKIKFNLISESGVAKALNFIGESEDIF